ncbi:protein of unknown function (plasmid) [Magnetospirillum sp. XM-1]|uniref:hypothetical protein n=1 Tax=Magnetospirillum sp. XM-1 TaxID=1663591 RepID=UPI00073E0E18|nr:hypothetical protein [Magnetospirillum sp. XM-1]CUW41860.1 protein of unknown function [Magnetospirillum sp. XM-1]
MPSAVFFLFLAGLGHFLLGIPVPVALVGGGILWIVWKAKWIILGILGLEMLFGGRGDDA